MKTELYPFLFRSNLRTLIWGTEEWNVSAVPSASSVIANGPLAGLSLPEVIAKHPEQILGDKVAEAYDGEFPLLVKVITAHDDLSIQVHPNDEMALRMHGKRGKTEMWYVIDAEPGAHLYAGFNRLLTPQQFRDHVANGTIIQCLARHDVHKGDVFYLPAGRVHAICGGITLAEVQQSSDVTYRIYDYNRLDFNGQPRQLHTDLAAEAIDYQVLTDYRTVYTHPRNNSAHCIDSDFFNVRVIDIEKKFHRDMRRFSSFVINMCLEGECRITVRSTQQEITLTQGHSCLIPAALADYDITPIHIANGIITPSQCKLIDAFV